MHAEHWDTKASIVRVDNSRQGSGHLNPLYRHGGQSRHRAWPEGGQHVMEQVQVGVTRLGQAHTAGASIGSKAQATQSRTHAEPRI